MRHEEYMKQAMRQSDVLNYVADVREDMVNSPPHYNQGEIECIDYIKQVLGPQGFVDYCHGQVIKYQHRYKYKDKAIEDMDKADYYLRKMRETLKEMST